jgi:hypothetical protein
MYVCMYVCVYVYMYVCMYINMHICIYVCAEGYYVFLACGNSTVLLFVCFQPAGGTTCCAYMQPFTWRPASCGIIFLAALACALPLVTIDSALRDVGGRRLFACGNPSVFACGYMDVWRCENLFCPLTKIDVKPISARWGINFII